MDCPGHDAAAFADAVVDVDANADGDAKADDGDGMYCTYN